MKRLQLISAILASLSNVGAGPCPLEEAAERGLFRKSQRDKLPPATVEMSDFWDSWIAVRKTPQGPVLIRYTLASTRGNYLPRDVAIAEGSPIWQRVIERDRHEFAYLRIFVSKDLGKTWTDQGPKLELADGPVWTGGTFFHPDQSASVFLTIPKAKGNDWAQAIYVAKSKDGIELEKPQLLFTAEQMQARAERQRLPYDFVSAADGYVSSFRDFHPFANVDAAGQAVVMAFVAAKVWRNGRLQPALAQLRARNAELTDWELLPPVDLPALPLPAYQIEVPNVVDAGAGRLVLHYAVSYERNGQYLRATYAAETRATQKSTLEAARWETVIDVSGQPLQITSPESSVYGVGAVRLPGTDQILYQGFFTGYHQTLPVRPTAVWTTASAPAVPVFSAAAALR